MNDMLRSLGWRLLHLPLHTLDRMIWRLRDAALRQRLGRVGRDFVFDPVTSKFVTPALFIAGDDCFLNAYAHVSGEVRLGDRVLVGPGVKLLSGNHLYGVPGYHARFLKASADNPELLEKLVVESDVWIGAGAIVVGGVTLGAGSVLAAGAVASRDVPPYVVATGAPARPIRRIFDDATLTAHLRALGTPPQEITALLARRRAACSETLALATPVRPPRFLYQERWIESAPEGLL